MPYWAECLAEKNHYHNGWFAVAGTSTCLQHLFRRTAHALAEESGLSLDHPLATTLQKHVMEGEVVAMFSVSYLPRTPISINMHFTFPYRLHRRRILDDTERMLVFQLDAAIYDVDELEPSLLGSNARLKMHFLLLEQKFFELLARNKTLEALNCLRHQLSPLRQNLPRVHELSR